MKDSRLEGSSAGTGFTSGGRLGPWNSAIITQRCHDRWYWYLRLLGAWCFECDPTSAGWAASRAAMANGSCRALHVHLQSMKHDLASQQSRPGHYALCASHAWDGLDFPGRSIVSGVPTPQVHRGQFFTHWLRVFPLANQGICPSPASGLNIVVDWKRGFAQPVCRKGET